MTPRFLSVGSFGGTGLAVLVDLIEARRESSILFNIVFHDFLGLGYFLDIWEKYCFFGIVVLMHTFVPALMVDPEVASHNCIPC